MRPVAPACSAVSCASIRSLSVTCPVVPAAFGKLGAIAVLTGPWLLAPQLAAFGRAGAVPQARRLVRVA